MSPVADIKLKTQKRGMQRTGEVTVRGVRSPVFEAGPKDVSEAAVFVHGNPGPGSDFNDLVDVVGAHGRALTLDLPGFGQADKPADFDYTVAGYARHLGGALDQLKVTRAHLVMHDFGGPFGLMWAAENPAQLGSVVLINAGILPGYRWHYMARIWRTPLLGDLSMLASSRVALGTILNRGHARRLPSAYLDRMWHNYGRETRRAILKLYRATDINAVSQRISQGLPGDVPALVVWGKQDPFISPDWAERQRDFFPKAEVVILEHSGHWPFIDDPPAVAEVVVAFLRRQLAAAP